MTAEDLQIMNAIAVRCTGLQGARRLSLGNQGVLVLRPDFARDTDWAIFEVWRTVVRKEIQERLGRDVQIWWGVDKAEFNPADPVVVRLLTELERQRRKQVSHEGSSHSGGNVVQSGPEMERPTDQYDTHAEDPSPSPVELAVELRERLTASQEAMDEQRRRLLIESVAMLDSERDRAIGEVLGSVALLMAAAKRIKGDLQVAVTTARELGVSWPEIARAAGVTYQTAMRRWDAEARRKHADYQRQRAQG